MDIALAPDVIVAAVQPSQVRGETKETVRGIAALEVAVAGDLSFLSNKRYRAAVASTQASVVLVPPGFAGEPAAGQLFLTVDNPSLALGRICSRIEQSLWPKPAPGVHRLAAVDPAAQVDPAATVGPFCVVEAGAVVGPGTHLQAQVFVGRNARIGANCWLMPGTLVATECVLGDRVRLQPGVVIGSDGFGYEVVQGRHEKLPQIGNVVVGDDVEIGSNSAVDRARFASTRIGEGTKIDNLVQIGHNVVIGKHCILCGQVGVSGSTVLEDYVVLGGQVGVAGHLKLMRGTQVGAQSGISRDSEPGAVLFGTPAIKYTDEQRFHILRQRLPELFKRVDALEQGEKPA